MEAAVAMVEWIIDTAVTVATGIIDAAVELVNGIVDAFSGDDGSSGSPSSGGDTIYDADEQPYSGTLNYANGSTSVITTPSGFVINLSVEENVSQETIDAIVATAIRHAEGVANGDIARDPTRMNIDSVNLRVVELSGGQGYSDGGNIVIIDPTGSGGGDLSNHQLGGLTVHELTHHFKGSL